MKYKLKDDVLFHVVNKKAKMQFDFDLSDYYDKVDGHNCGGT